MIPRRIVTMIGVAGLCASAPAEINWTTQMQFRNRVGGVDSAPLVGNQFVVTATGTYTFTVQVGIFDVTGLGPLEANYGLNNWTANLSATGLMGGETLGVTPTNARVSPFVFGPATAFGGRLVDPARIVSVDAARDVSGGAFSPWRWDTVLNQPEPMPTLPTNPSPGAESFTSVWRFRVTVTELTGTDVVVTFAGQAGPIVRWVVLDSVPPDELESGVAFLGLTPTPVLRDYAPTTLTLHRVPAAGVTVTWLAAAACVGGRRRRRSGGGRV